MYLSCKDIIGMLKTHFDPHIVMNLGGTLGLDMEIERVGKQCFFWGKKKASETRI
jgi:hypothetical protein